VEQELLTLPEHLSSPDVFSGVRVTRSLVLYLCFCQSLFALLYFFFWPLCCLFFFDIRIMIAPLVSSNFSFEVWRFPVTSFDKNTGVEICFTWESSSLASVDCVCQKGTQETSSLASVDCVCQKGTHEASSLMSADCVFQQGTQEASSWF